jgi:hypothetical protein
MRQNLQDWEKYFEPYFQRIHLLGEIPFASLECEEIGLFIQQLVKNKGQTDATHFIKRFYPCAFCMFLVGMGLYGYDEGNYWSAVKETTGINSPHQLGWGELFLEILNDYHLPNFQEIEGHRFLTPILAHGGIPEKSLGDFFHYVLQPWLKKPELAGLSGREYVPKAIEHLDSYPMVDKPIRRFLEYGQQAAWDFLDHCIEMGRAYQQDGELPTPVDVGLPPYVLRGYRQFLDEAPVSGSSKRLRSPRLLLEPYGPGFSLYLPPQPLEAASIGTGRFLWQIGLRLCGEGATSDHLTWQSERVRARRQGYDVLTDEQTVPLDDPAHEIEIRFNREVDVAENPNSIELLRPWRLYLRPTADQPPLVVFRHPGGSAVRWNQTLPAGRYWLLTPRSVTVLAEGGEFFEEGSSFFGPWEDWRLQAWDLEKAIAIHLMEGGQECCPPIALRQALEEPELIGGECLAIDRDPDRVPVYVGLPPALRIPLRPGRALSHELAHWQVTIVSRWSAEPTIECKATLSDVTGVAQISAAHVELSLQHWLGNRPCGTYQVNLSGPGGLGGEFCFRVWPELLLEKLQRFYLPEAQGAVAVQFEMLVPSGCSVQPQPGVETTQVAQSDSGFLVTVASDATLAELHLVDAQGKQEPIRLPLFLAVPRLRWGLSLDGAGMQLEWQTSPIKLSVDALLQSHQPGLHLALALLGTEPLFVKLQLVDSATGEMLMEGRRALTWQPGQERGYFPLGEFSDTLRHYADISNFEFWLEVWDPEQKTPTHVTLVRLGRRLEIHYALLFALESPNFELVWEEPQPLRNRRVRIASLWQPWAETIELPIPDEARESITFTAALPPSHYKVHFFTASPWEKTDPLTPLPVDSYLIETATPEQRLHWIRQRLQIENRQAFPLHFENACIHETRNSMKEQADEIAWCYQNLVQASPELILTFYRWLGWRDQATQKAVGIKMFYPAAIRKILDGYSHTHTLRHAYLAIFPYIQRKLIKPETALLILENETDPAVTQHAFQVLFEREQPEAITHLLDWVQTGLLGETDAEDLLALKPAFSFRYLDNASESPVRNRLLVHLLERVPNIDGLITKGRWVRCDAGYGKIEQIKNAENGRDLSYTFTATTNIILTIELRPGPKAETIEINLLKRTIVFQNRARIFGCSRDGCWKFISADQRLIMREHNHAAHQGIGPAFTPLSNPIPLRSNIELLDQEPANIFA